MVIETENITKWYGKKLGCQDICLSVSEGQVFGFLGHNGAGKSTFVKMLTGLIFPSSGRGEIFGRPLGDLKVKKRIGFLPENFRYQDWLTGFQLLSFHGDLYGMNPKDKMKRIDEVLDVVRLSGSEDAKIRAYSKGMQQRLGLASALLNEPDLLILDEPTSAMDPLGRKEVRDIILRLKAEGKTIFLNSHLLSEVEVICDHVALIKKGRIIASGTIDELRDGKTEVEMRIDNFTPSIRAGLKSLGIEIRGNGTRQIAVVSSRDQIPLLVEAIVKNGGLLYKLNPINNSLENLFLDLMGEGGGETADSGRVDNSRSF